MAKDYLPSGVKVDPYAGNEPTLDPELEKIRDEEMKALSEIKVEPRSEPTIDPELVKARDEEIARDQKRAKGLGFELRTQAPKDDNVAKVSTETKAAKKSTSKKS